MQIGVTAVLIVLHFNWPLRITEEVASVIMLWALTTSFSRVLLGEIIAARLSPPSGPKMHNYVRTPQLQTYMHAYVYILFIVYQAGIT